MEIIDINNVLLVSLWKLSVKEVIGDNYSFAHGITKIALSLPNQKISIEDFAKLEQKNWIILEVEATLKDANSQELENYLKSYFDEIARNVNELKITFANFDSPPIGELKNKDELMDGFTRKS